jgi:hypothetical protein
LRNACRGSERYLREAEIRTNARHIDVVGLDGHELRGISLERILIIRERAAYFFVRLRCRDLGSLLGGTANFSRVRPKEVMDPVAG